MAAYSVVFSIDGGRTWEEYGAVHTGAWSGKAMQQMRYALELRYGRSVKVHQITKAQYPEYGLEW